VRRTRAAGAPLREADAGRGGDRATRWWTRRDSRGCVPRELSPCARGRGASGASGHVTLRGQVVPPAGGDADAVQPGGGGVCAHGGGGGGGGTAMHLSVVGRWWRVQLRCTPLFTVHHAAWPGGAIRGAACGRQRGRSAAGQQGRPRVRWRRRRRRQSGVCSDN